ncbi:ABC transporter permease [Salmonirosea aquatica]
MLFNYFKIAWRHLYQNRLLNFIGIGGLATGLAVTLLIVLYIAHEYSYDRFHRNADRIVKVELKHTDTTTTYSIPWMSYRFGEAVKNASPEVESFARFSSGGTRSMTVQSDEGHQFYETNFAFADTGFVRMFDFPFVAGDPATALSRPATLLLTERMARKYFGSANPLGRTIEYTSRDNTKFLFEVTGVLRDPPPNSTIQFGFLAQLDAVRAIDREEYGEGFDKIKDEVGAGGRYDTYLLLRAGASAKKVAAHIPALLTTPKEGLDPNDNYYLYPLADMHLEVGLAYSKNRMALFGVLAVFVLVLALINFVNLATARSVNRAKEVSVRKVVGATRKSLIAQFYTDSSLQVVLAFCLAGLLFVLFQPFFYDILQLSFDPAFLCNAFFLMPTLLLFLICILLSGGYPALLLSGFSPIFGLKGKANPSQGTAQLRAGLTVFQFVVSVTLIIGAIVVKLQLNLFLNKDVGISRSRVVTVPLNREEGMDKHYAAIRREISQLPGVEKVTASSLVMYDHYMNSWNIKRLDQPKEVSVNTFAVDEEFIPTLQIKWLVPPRPTKGLSTSGQIVINERAARELGLNARNYQQTLDLGDGTRKEVVGIMKDFNYMSLERDIKPMAMYIGSDTTFRDYLYVKLTRNAPIEKTMAGMGHVYDRYKTEHPFEYAFLEEVYQRLYEIQGNTSRMIVALTGLAIFIACLGLFGLATFTAEQRTKEIGVRKVLGASVASIVTLLSKDFLKLVLIAIVIASPIAWWITGKWLEEFAYRVDVAWWVFILAGTLALGIALLTVSFQSVRAALTNPARSLRSE